MSRLPSHTGGLLFVGVGPGVAELMAEWASRHGRPSAVADSVPAALDMLRRIPFVAVVCGSHELLAHDTFGDCLHRRQPRTALIVVEGVRGSAAPSRALEHGAVDRLVPPCDRTRFGVALARAEEWASNSQACRRRAVIARVNGRVRALERLLARHVAALTSERPTGSRDRLGASQAVAGGRGAIATFCVSLAARHGASGGAGSLPALDAISRTLAAVVTAKWGRAEATDSEGTTYCRAVAAVRVAPVVARLWGRLGDPLQAPRLEHCSYCPDHSKYVARDARGGAAA